MRKKQAGSRFTVMCSDHRRTMEYVSACTSFAGPIPVIRTIIPIPSSSFPVSVGSTRYVFFFCHEGARLCDSESGLECS